MDWELRYAAHPADAKSYDTDRLRNDFLVEDLFRKGKVKMVYSMYDRLIVGGAMPGKEGSAIEPFEELKAEFFLQRREMGIINVGGPASLKRMERNINWATKRPFIWVVEIRTWCFSLKMKPSRPNFILIRPRPIKSSPIKK